MVVREDKMTAVKDQTKREAQASTSGTGRLDGKVALVTGGSRGIGAAIAAKLAAEGAAVAISYASNKDAADKVVAQLTESGARAVAFKANASDSTDGKRLVAEVEKVYGKIDILVNNAGVFEMGPIDVIDIDHYTRVFDVNVKGVIATTVAALPHLNDGGRIINISSGAAQATMAGASVYSATKSALDTLTRIWAQDLGKRQITVNSVSPGVTVTDMFNGAMPVESHQMLIEKTALGRFGQPEDIADVVAFIASHDARWITGRVINVDGGIAL
jgi:3-oxoacyl-[acyl-carrier protein] reductase